MSFDSYSEGETEPVLRVAEDEFDLILDSMVTKDLLDTVVLLQKEMTAEQDHFNMLSQQIGELTEGSPEYEELSEEIVASQARLAMLMGRNMKCFTQQTTLQNRELMERYDDNSVPNGEVDSSDDEYNNVRTHLTSYSTSSSVNGHSSNTYQNGIHDKHYKEPVLRKGVPSRDYFEDTDSYPDLKFGVGEPDICDEPAFCDEEKEDQTVGTYEVNPQPELKHPEALIEVDETQYTEADTVLDNAADLPHTSNENTEISENGDTIHSRTQSSFPIVNSKDISATTSNIPSNNSPISSPTSELSPETVIPSPAIQLSNNISQVELQNGNIVTQNSGADAIIKDSQTVTKMDNDSEVMVSISNEGLISLVPKEKKTVKSPVVQKGSYRGPNQAQSLTPETDFKKKKVKFDELRKKFNSPTENEVSDVAEDQGNVDEKARTNEIHTEQMQLSINSQHAENENEKNKQSNQGDKQSADKKRSEVSMVLSIKTTSINNDINETDNNRSPSPFEHLEASDIHSPETKAVEQTPEKRIQPEGAVSVETSDESQWGHNQLSAQQNNTNNITPSHVLTQNNLKPTVPSVINKSSWQDNETEISSCAQSTAGEIPGATADSQSAGSAAGDTEDSQKKRVVTTLDVKPQPLVQKQVDEDDGRTSPFFIIEDDQVLELTTATTLENKEMGNQSSQIKALSAQKVQSDPVVVDIPVKEVQVVESVNVNVEAETKLPPALVPSEGFTSDEKVKDRVTLRDWDPTAVFEELYKVKLEHDTIPENELPYINMEGYMEKLPVNKKKATLLKTWKRRYFKAEDGILYYYESQDPGEEDLDDADEFDEENNTQHKDKVNGSIQLNGGTLEELGGRLLGIDDGRGSYLVVRCPTDREYEDWKRCLETQVVDVVRMNHVRPVLRSTPNRQRKVVIIDIGSCSVRAGILGDNPSLPQVFFPCVMAMDKETGVRTFGIGALKPEIRSKCVISYPVRPAVKADKFAIDINAMPALFDKIFKDLNVDPSKYWVMFSTPGNFSDKIKEQFMDILINRFSVIGANIVNQTLLSLYSYNSTTGVVIDVGERLEIVPVTDGYIVESGVTRQPYGGHRITEALNASFTESKYRFFTDVEFPIVRLAMEKSCFISTNYKDDEKRCLTHPDEFTETVDLNSYNLPKGSWTHVTHDISRFKSSEGLFNTELWGMDNPALHKLVQKAVLACPLDFRRTMWRSIYLSGGVSLLPGFGERLQKELQNVVPATIKVQVHQSPQRYHAAYIGACTMANLSVFEQSCILADEWKQQGAPCLRRWHMY